MGKEEIRAALDKEFAPPPTTMNYIEEILDKIEAQQPEVDPYEINKLRWKVERLMREESGKALAVFSDEEVKARTEQILAERGLL